MIKVVSWKLASVLVRQRRTDLHACCEAPVENPFGPKVLTMFPVQSVNHVSGMDQKEVVVKGGIEPPTHGFSVAATL